MSVSLIVAMAQNRTIGVNNTLPWRCPEDLKHFKALTMGHPMIMGRKTWESLPPKFRPLPGRLNIVVTRNADYVAEGATVANALEAAVKVGAGKTALFVIGGAELYAHTLPHAQRLELTEIDAAFEGDAYFPAFDRAQWREVKREPGKTEAGLAYAFVTYERV